MDKHERMAELRSEARSLADDACDPGSRLVWGDGDLDAELALVGEAPGAQEDRVGRPFVGQAGQLLDAELGRAGIARDRVYISNVVKCRPTRKEAGRVSNRPPTAREVSAWLGLLMRELEIVSPRVIVCLGGVSASAMIHPGFAMTAERGQWFNGPFGARTMATFHPAYLLRMRGYAGDTTLDLFREDLDSIRAQLGRASS